MNRRILAFLCTFIISVTMFISPMYSFALSDELEITGEENTENAESEDDKSSIVVVRKEYLINDDRSLTDDSFSKAQDTLSGDDNLDEEIMIFRPDFLTTEGNASDVMKEAFSDSTIVSVQTDGNIIVVASIHNNKDSDVRTSQKSFGVDYDVYIDNVRSFRYTHNITFTYAIPTSNGEMAQITTAGGLITYTNSSSAYYPDTANSSSYFNGQFGNPAKYITSMPIYVKSSNTYHATRNFEAICYGNGFFSSYDY